jgi:hypothetical protein
VPGTACACNALGRRLESAQHQTPHILTRGVITPQEAEKLFEMWDSPVYKRRHVLGLIGTRLRHVLNFFSSYFDSMNLSVSLLDPVLYAAQRTFYRSPFLFTIISEYSNNEPENLCT